MTNTQKELIGNIKNNETEPKLIKTQGMLLTTVVIALVLLALNICFGVSMIKANHHNAVVTHMNQVQQEEIQDLKLQKGVLEDMINYQYETTNAN
ncbi:MAG: hypothetical protein ACK5NA_08410 [Enterococcus sp.]